MASAFPGDQAPDFKLQNENEEWVTLGELVKDAPVMLAFYPGDFTPVCTRQLCGYQNAYDRFVSYGIRVVGISANTPEEHQKFRNAYRFGFNLLSDPGHGVAKAYGITSLFMLGGLSRAVFILGKGGKILYRHVEATSLTHRKADEIIEVLDGLKAEGRL
jgi:peroxiredoxin Q/BCP